MISAYQITAGTSGADDQAANTAAHEELLWRLNKEARRIGWSGSAIDFYRRLDGYVSISIKPGDRLATLDDVRAFRDAQQAAIDAVPQAHEQKGLFQ